MGLAQWLISSVGQNATDKYLKLPIVSPSAPKTKIKAKQTVNFQTRNRTRPLYKTSAHSIAV